MAEDHKAIGAHGGGIPPGWDFPEARQVAEEGLDLWLIDSQLKLSFWERIVQNFEVAAMGQMLQDGMGRCDVGDYSGNVK
jgi:hypothetical protein